MNQPTSDRCADAIPEPDHRRGRGVVKGSRRQYPGSRDHETHKIDYSDPFVRALLSPEIIGRLKEILAEGD